MNTNAKIPQTFQLVFPIAATRPFSLPFQ